MEQEDKIKCRNCTYDLKKGIRRCPYCGILNPTLRTKEILQIIIAMLIVMFIYSYFQ